MSPFPETTDYDQATLPERIIKRDLREADFDVERLQRTLCTIRRQYKDRSLLRVLPVCGCHCAIERNEA